MQQVQWNCYQMIFFHLLTLTTLPLYFAKFKYVSWFLIDWNQTYYVVVVNAIIDVDNFVFSPNSMVNIIIFEQYSSVNVSKCNYIKIS